MADPTYRPCSAATSPLAYLADLLGYVTAHVKDGPAPLTLPALTAKFHQPFADLPAACDCMDRQVSEARIAVDVLRSYLEAKGLPCAWIAGTDRARQSGEIVPPRGLRHAAARDRCIVRRNPLGAGGHGG